MSAPLLPDLVAFADELVEVALPDAEDMEFAGEVVEVVAPDAVPVADPVVEALPDCEGGRG